MHFLYIHTVFQTPNSYVRNSASLEGHLHCRSITDSCAAFNLWDAQQGGYRSYHYYASWPVLNTAANYLNCDILWGSKASISPWKGCFLCPWITTMTSQWDWLGYFGIGVQNIWTGWTEPLYLRMKWRADVLQWHIADISRWVFRVHHGGNTPLLVSQQLSHSQLKQVNALSWKTGFPSILDSPKYSSLFSTVYACRRDESDGSW